jgi:hypothetical protein
MGELNICEGLHLLAPTLDCARAAALKIEKCKLRDTERVLCYENSQFPIFIFQFSMFSGEQTSRKPGPAPLDLLEAAFLHLVLGFGLVLFVHDAAVKQMYLPVRVPRIPGIVRDHAHGRALPV